MKKKTTEENSKIKTSECGTSAFRLWECKWLVCCGKLAFMSANGRQGRQAQSVSHTGNSGAVKMVLSEKSLACLHDSNAVC